MAFKATPGVHRTPRTRALEIGTRPEGFTEHLPYNAAAGVPEAQPGMAPAGTYRELPAQVTDAGAKPIENPKPFNVSKR